MTLFGSRSLEDKGSSGPTLSKAEFVEKVRQSNQACHAGDYPRAILLYGEALGVDPQNCILYSNRSAAYMKIQQYDRALDDAIKAQLLNPKWPKVGMSTLRCVYGGMWEGGSPTTVPQGTGASYQAQGLEGGAWQLQLAPHGEPSVPPASLPDLPSLP